MTLSDSDARITDLEGQVRALTARLRRAEQARNVLLAGIYSVIEYLDVTERAAAQGRPAALGAAIDLLRLACKRTLAAHARTYEPPKGPPTP